MRIALIHFHLKRGGVTTVIRHQVEAIKSIGWNPLVLAGEPPDETFPCEVQIVEGLAYDQLLPPSLTADRISESIIRVIRGKWPRGSDLLHVHNPTLAKNSHLQAVLTILQHHGMAILCQIHDFAEDGRPGAYFKAPYLGDCHYAAINPRDYQLLLDAGLHQYGCHLLPNTISMEPAMPDESPQRCGVLYPIRAIRRKNIGEAILLSLFFQRVDPLIITLPPNSPNDHISYHRWKIFVRRHDLPVQFDAGLDAEFSTLLAHCRFVITTSITEGFGFAFLEAWTAGKALWGRMLPDICQGFVGHGLRLDWLYSHLWVPLAWLDRKMLESMWKAALAEAWHQFELPCSRKNLEAAWRTVSVNERIDFGLLDEGFQETVIHRVMTVSADRTLLINLNPFLERPGPPDNHEHIVVANRRVVEQHYRPAAYARRLKGVYQSVVSTPVRHELNKAILAKAFLSADEFSLLKWGSIREQGHADE